MRRMWRGSSLAFLFVTVFVDMIGYGIVIPLLPFCVQQYASGAILIGLLGSLYAAMQFFGGPFLGGLSDRAGRRPVLLLCLFGTSLAYLLLGLAGTLLLLITAITLAGGASGTLATAQAYIADSTEPADRARGSRPRTRPDRRPRPRPRPRRPLEPGLAQRSGLRRFRVGSGQRGVRFFHPCRNRCRVCVERRLRSSASTLLRSSVACWAWSASGHCYSRSSF